MSVRCGTLSDMSDKSDKSDFIGVPQVLFECLLHLLGRVGGNISFKETWASGSRSFR